MPFSGISRGVLGRAPAPTSQFEYFGLPFYPVFPHSMLAILERVPVGNWSQSGELRSQEKETRGSNTEKLWPKLWLHQSQWQNLPVLAVAAERQSWVGNAGVHTLLSRMKIFKCAVLQHRGLSMSLQRAKVAEAAFGVCLGCA